MTEQGTTIGNARAPAAGATVPRNRRRLTFVRCVISALPRSDKRNDARPGHLTDAPIAGRWLRAVIITIRRPAEKRLQGPIVGRRFWVACRHSAQPRIGMEIMNAASMFTQRFAL
jgi:hypothetical protein